MKAVLISIKPKYCALIASGEKTVEVRKSRPKLETSFKCYIYCTRGPYYKNTNYLSEPLYFLGEQFPVNGKVFCEFVCDRINEFKVFEDGAVQDWNFADLDQSCLRYEDVADYVGIGKRGYGWHISDLKIYDTPKELSEFSNWVDIGPWSQLTRMTRPPTSWCYVEGLKETT